jgi:hypothetical protein
MDHVWVVPSGSMLPAHRWAHIPVAWITRELTNRQFTRVLQGTVTCVNNLMMNLINTGVALCSLLCDVLLCWREVLHCAHWADVSLQVTVQACLLLLEPLSLRLAC